MAGFLSSLFRRNEPGQDAEPAEATVTTPQPSQPITLPIIAPVDGACKPIDEVPDETFAAKILGDGFGVVPTTRSVLAPVSGTITTIANAKHAVGITTPGGVEVLIHIGVDTVQLNGAPFTMHVTTGQTVQAGDPIVDVDINAVVAAEKATDVIVVFTNPDRIETLTVPEPGAVAAGTEIGKLVVKA